MNFVEIYGKQYLIESRTLAENRQFCDLLTSAASKLEQAVSNISYNSYPNLNNEIIETLKKMHNELYDMEINIASEFTHIEKLTLATSPMHYYELHYFHNRKDNGVIYIESELNLNKFMSEDSFLFKLTEQGKLSSSKLDYITEITEISKTVYNKRTK